MNKYTVTAVHASVVALAVPGLAQAHEPGPASPSAQIREVTGQGTGVCPRMSLCLHQDHTLNAGKPAAVWVFPVTKDRQDFSLRGHDAADRPSSAYMNVNDREWPEAIEGSEHGEVEYELTRAGWERNR